MLLYPGIDFLQRYTVLLIESLNELLFSSFKEWKSTINSILLLTLRGIRRDAAPSHELEKLAWNFSEGLSGKFLWVPLILVEIYELYDVGGSRFARCRFQRSPIISIQLLHWAEMGITDANNDNWEGQLGATHYLVLGSLHIADCTIGQDNEDVVLLLLLGDIKWLNMWIDFFENIFEVSRATKGGVLQEMLVGIKYPI